ncbi:macrophage mannose receptor 1-like isoform 2-T2 [Aphomia sociella]
MISIKIIYYVLLLTELILHYTHAQRDKKFFRKDYRYLEETQSFYKFHTFKRNWQDAKGTCKSEGAKLFYPSDESEANAVRNTWKDSQLQYIFVGISSLFVKGLFDTVDGLPISNIYEKWGRGEPNDAGGKEDCVALTLRDGTYNDDNCANKNPFICKKTLASLEWNIACNISDTDYTYCEALNKCYKFHLIPKTWNEAYATCHAEQSHLAVIENQKEADFLIEFTRNTPKDHVRGDYLRGSVLLGFHKLDGEGWKTVKGTSLEESGYSYWANEQSDGHDQEKCGSMLNNGQLKELSCNQKSFFICEHDLPNPASQVTESTSWLYPSLESTN